MGHTATTINGTGGVCPIRDVCAVLGIAANGDIATVCSSAAINMWALCKPVRYDKISDITMAERKAAAHGLAMHYLAADATAAQSLCNALQAAIPTPGKWTYNRVRPGTDWSRITDFLNNDSPTLTGYNHAAKPMVSGFGDITIYDDEFGSETKTWSFNFKWGASTYQGTGTVTGIEIPLTELMSGITDGTWRIALLVFFPSGGKYQVGIASAPGAIPSGTSPATDEIGKMMVRPAGTGQLKNLMQTAYNAGNKSLTAIPVLAKGLSRGGSGTADKWSPAGPMISMPLGEKITINLAAAISSITFNFSSLTLKYVGGSSSPTYNLVPVGSSGQNAVALAKPSATNSFTCGMVVDFTLTTVGKYMSVGGSSVYIGLAGTLMNAPASKIEEWNGSAWVTTGSIQVGANDSRRYRVTATENSNGNTRTALMNYIENLPRSNGSRQNQVPVALQISGKWNTSGNHFNHMG